MNAERVRPENCRDMGEVRDGVDRLDEAIVALLAERFRYMAAAARIETERGAVRDEARKADVLAKVRRRAESEGAPAAAMAELYERLVEESISYELALFDARQEP